MSTARRLTVLAALTGAAASAVLVSGTSTPAAAGADRQQQLADARRAAARFHDVAAAERAGFQPASHCETSPEGGMGLHYFNPANVGSLDPAKPAVLLYAPSPSGKLRLTGVEYFVPDADQDLSTAGDRPSMFDGVQFQGPMEGHAPGMPRHYDLHVWLWQNNPSGVFAQWNPTVTC